MPRLVEAARDMSITDASWKKQTCVLTDGAYQWHKTAGRGQPSKEHRSLEKGANAMLCLRTALTYLSVCPWRGLLIAQQHVSHNTGLDTCSCNTTTFHRQALLSALTITDVTRRKFST